MTLKMFCKAKKAEAKKAAAKAKKQKRHCQVHKTPLPSHLCQGDTNTMYQYSVILKKIKSFWCLGVAKRVDLQEIENRERQLTRPCVFSSVSIQHFCKTKAIVSSYKYFQYCSQGVYTSWKTTATPRRHRDIMPQIHIYPLHRIGVFFV